MLLHTDIGEAFVKSWAPRRHYSFLQVIAIYFSWAHLVMMSVSAAIGDMMLAHDQSSSPSHTALYSSDGWAEMPSIDWRPIPDLDCIWHKSTGCRERNLGHTMTLSP